MNSYSSDPELYRHTRLPVRHPRAHQVGVVKAGGDVGLLHHRQRQELLPGVEVQAAVQHDAHLLELHHVAWLVGVLRQTVEPHPSMFIDLTFMQLPI